MAKKKIYTLCLIYQHPKVLLGMKKRGFGQGRWNGFGGKVNQGESIRKAAKREVYEEAGIDIKKMSQFGVVDFKFKSNPEILEVHMFQGYSFSGIPKETEEMKPKWFHIKSLPFQEMWPDDKHWFPLFLEGKKFYGRFLFDKSNNIINYELSLIKRLKKCLILKK